jgi:integrase
MHFTKYLHTQRYASDNIIQPILSGKINVYELLDGFVSYLSKQKVSPATLKIYIAIVRSFLEYYDIDISNSKFKRKVKLPKYYPDPEEPLTLADIRTLLEYNNNHRLRTYILLLTSSGMRAMEACYLRVQDMDFSTSPTRITIRGSTTKTKKGRIIYCSDESTKHIHKLIEIHKLNPQDLLFAVQGSKSPQTLYNRLLEQFEKLQHIANKDQRKENSKRRIHTFHSFRRTAYSIIGEQTNTDYSNWFLGHHHSVYWTHKETERRNIYRTKCMPFLTIYQETRDNTIEATLREKDKTIRLLSNRIADIEHNQKILMDLMQDPRELKKKLEES